jgi:hypothetical protein
MEAHQEQTLDSFVSSRMVIIGISMRGIFATLQADNNSTDIHLNSGEITAFKTLKHFEVHYLSLCSYSQQLHSQYQLYI